MCGVILLFLMLCFRNVRTQPRLINDINTMQKILIKVKSPLPLKHILLTSSEQIYLVPNSVIKNNLNALDSACCQRLHEFSKLNAFLVKVNLQSIFSFQINVMNNRNILGFDKTMFLWVSNFAKIFVAHFQNALETNLLPLANRYEEQMILARRNSYWCHVELAFNITSIPAPFQITCPHHSVAKWNDIPQTIYLLVALQYFVTSL